VSLLHSLRLRDDIVLASGQPKLDLLNGDATGNGGGSARHVIDMEGGWFNKGFGVRLIANYQSGTAVTGGSIPGGGIAPNLYFSDLLTANTRLYINFDNRKVMVAKFPFLKGSRLALRVNNLTNAIQSVRDSNGVQPLRYQSGYLNPLGRTFEISFRKIF
ncbi:MAG: ABC transporter ATP-binding protein, partial [Chakrabartia sp.]